MGGWGAAPLPASLRPSPQREADPVRMVRSVTGAVIAVSAALRGLNAALDDGEHDQASVDRAMAALNAAVSDQALTARSLLRRLDAP